MKIRIATRSSKLALWQATHIKNRLENEHNGISIEIIPIKTKGDISIDKPLYKIGGKGLFIKELEEKLLDNQADIAVHCIKDFHINIPENFELLAVMERDSESDVLLTKNKIQNIYDMNPGSIIGTSSLRRIFQLKKIRPDLLFHPLRGNIDTRISLLNKGDFDAIVLADAGLKRLGIEYENKIIFCHSTMIPAVGQGALGIEIRKNDLKTKNLVAFLNHQKSNIEIKCERAFVRALDADCRSAVGCFAKIIDESKIELEGIIGEVTSLISYRGKIIGDISDAEKIGIELAEKLLAKGAKNLIFKFRT